LNAIRALLFDVFGTVVDWRGSLVREGRELAARKGLELDWAAFADAWRAGYRPAMERVRRGVRRPRELGRPSAYNLPHDTSFDAVANDFSHLAEELGA
jgi:FMN phosphatase YigB (HAD superfamily)